MLYSWEEPDLKPRAELVGQFDEVERYVRAGVLYDWYGRLLTERQREVFELHYLRDMSLGEIAESQGVSRQAVHDLLARALSTLEGYEKVLGFVDRDRNIAARLDSAALGLSRALADLGSLAVPPGKGEGDLGARRALESAVHEIRLAISAVREIKTLLSGEPPEGTSHGGPEE